VRPSPYIEQPKISIHKSIGNGSKSVFFGGDRALIETIWLPDMASKKQDLSRSSQSPALTSKCEESMMKNYRVLGRVFGRFICYF
jgi:hypothetical protein